MNITEISAEVLSGGQSTKTALSVAAASLPVVARPTNHPVGLPVSCLLTLDVTGFGRKGVAPTALSDGTDQIFLANNTYRIQLMEGERLSIILAAGTGNAYFTPGA